MKKLALSSPTAAEYFEGIGASGGCLWPHASTRALFGNRTSNLVESYNSLLLEARSDHPLDAADKV